MVSRPRAQGRAAARRGDAADTTAESSSVWSVAKDAAAAMRMVAVSDWRRWRRSFVYVPTGMFAMLAACFGMDRLLRLGGVAFPASVACLVLLFAGLLVCDRALGSRTTQRLARAVNVAGGWSLRWLNLFFTPAFVLLPRSPRVSAAEVGTMAAVFVAGFSAMFVATAYATRWIQLLTSPPRRALHERSDGVRHDVHPGEGGAMADADGDGDGDGDGGGGGGGGVAGEELVPLLLRADFGSGSCDGIRAMPPLPPQSHAAAYITVRGQNLDDPLSSFSDTPAPHARLARPHPSPATRRLTSAMPAMPAMPTVPTPTTRADLWAEWLSRRGDALVYAGLGLAVGLPLYYGVGCALPLQLSVNVLMFMGALSLPPAWRQVLHPVLVSAFGTLLAIWLLGRVRGDDLAAVLEQYRPGNTYLRVWATAAAAAPSPASSAVPGAGDVLASALDASIVSLALPMYQYRRELRIHFWAIVVPSVALSIASLFAYPVVCYRLGISATRSLAFTSRSLTLALATPAVRNLGGDLNTVAAVAILSGVLGVLIGLRVLSWLRIPEDDYVTRGVTFGANASALGTALLLRSDPRAAAISSLAMGLFGTITVAFSSIPAVVHVVRSLVGLS